MKKENIITPFQSTITKKEAEKGIRKAKARKLWEERAKRKKEYIVYAGYVDNVCVYVGSGKVGKEEHLNSGVSHIYKANELYFRGIGVKVSILERCFTKNRATKLEKIKIAELNPEWNIEDKSAIPSKYKHTLRNLANCSQYKDKQEIHGLLLAASNHIDDEGCCSFYGHSGLKKKMTKLTRVLARVIREHKVERFPSCLYTLHLDTEFLNLVEKNTTQQGEVLWTEELLNWGSDRAYTNK